jgi:hypothetical protein
VPKNVLLFTIRGADWYLDGVLFVSALFILLVAGFAIVPISRRWGTVRKLSPSEAARVAMNPCGPDGGEKFYGPSTGKAWSYEFDVKSLRAAWKRNDMAEFWVPALHASSWHIGFLLLMGSMGVSMQNPLIPVLGSSVPICCLLVIVCSLWMASRSPRGQADATSATVSEAGAPQTTDTTK